MLDVEVTRGDGDLAGEFTVSGAHGKGDGRRTVPIESHHEQALPRGLTHRHPIHEQTGARRGAAKGEAALLKAAGQLQVAASGHGRPGEARREAGEDQAAAVRGQDLGSGAVAAAPGTSGFSSRQRARAWAGPA